MLSLPPPAAQQGRPTRRANATRDDSPGPGPRRSDRLDPTRLGPIRTLYFGCRIRSTPDTTCRTHGVVGRIVFSSGSASALKLVRACAARAGSASSGGGVLGNRAPGRSGANAPSPRTEARAALAAAWPAATPHRGHSAAPARALSSDLAMEPCRSAGR
eukprot:362417-Chlamydomonas_euryale.AAC.5